MGPPETLDLDDLEIHLSEAIKVAVDHIRNISNDPVVPQIPHDTLYDLIPHELPDEGVGVETAIEDVKRTVYPHCTKIGHPKFLAWIVTSPSPAGTIGEILNVGLNQVPLSYKGGPAATVLEEIVVGWFCELFGYADHAGGILVSGGTVANLTALAVAREVHAPQAMKHGLQSASRPLTMYVSDQGHMSVERSAGMLGIGADLVRKIPTDERFKMRVDALRNVIERDRQDGLKPFCVVAQAGAVNTGSIDPLSEIADVCAEKDLWLHVDAAYGGGAIVTPEGASLLGGVERADSIATDPHKWFFIPVEAGCTLIRRREHLYNTFKCKAGYLGEETATDFMNFGFQLTRASRALKTWFALRAYGLNRLSRIVERNMALAREFKRSVEKDECWQILAPVELSIVCFRYVPNPEWSEEDLNRLQYKILTELEQGGTAFLTPTVLGGRVALRVCFTNHRTTSKDSDELLRSLEEIGKRVSDPPVQ
jgi:aromatic-L-amino-acid decarboxylase